jgi:GWxTD domain-containing protein
MKKITFITLFVLFIQTGAWCLDASVSFATFHTEQQNYIEVYLHFVGQTVQFAELENKQLQAGVEVIIIFKQDGHIVKFDKYALNSPLSTYPLNFFDQKRYALGKGLYTMEVSLKDLNKADNSKTLSTEIDMNYVTGKVQQSDIQLLLTYKKDSTSSFNTKNGYYMETVPFDFYDKNATHISFYNEIYNLHLSGSKEVYVSYLIEKVLGNGGSEPFLAQHKKRTMSEVLPILSQIDIQQLPSGNYRLIIESRNEKKELLTQKSVAFQRSNPYLNIKREDLSTDALAHEFVAELTPEDLRYSIKAIAFKVPDADIAIINIILQENDLAAQRRFLFNYWAGYSPNQPAYAYRKFMEVASAVDKMYDNGFGYGFETDRGRVYMKYGRPDDMITVEDEPSAPPYEIWIYYDFPATKQSNVKFIFYNPSLVANGHTLLHSTARGEVNNPKWQIELYRDAPNDFQGDNSFDATEIGNGINRNAVRLFNDN